MRARSVLFGALSVAAGFGFGLLLPRSWGFEAPYGFLFGGGILLLGFRGRSPLRAAAFLSLTWLFLYLSYGAPERTDLTWPLATIASWSMVETWLGRGRTQDGRP
ncbi:MAG: hypothetical protein HY568_05000 [Candidatus Latescibacteria bacterium]|nr:hypothetical protein [Candidatus Latescibacterota bacterium]